MREILFRGKTAEGKWIEGDLYLSRLKSIVMISYYTEHGNRMTKTVNPETVGQYTGLTDKNGNKIFEGDILQQYDNVWLNGHTTGQLRELCKFEVYYDEPYAGFTPCIWRDDDREKYNFNEDYCIVIGNIHDNLELLKG